MEFTNRQIEKEINTTPTVVQARKYITFEEACLYLGIKKSKLYALSGEVIPYHKAAGQRWYLPEDLNTYIASGRVATYRETRSGRGKGRSKRK